jgi:broad specificity phosphatase PhoE
MRTWYLVRHGQTEWNATQRMQGQHDSKLTEAGRGHALANGRLLKRLGVDMAFASPLGRVRETVAIMHGAHPLTPRWDDRLMEWSCGEWSGELYADLAVKHADAWRAWETDKYNYRPKGGENFVDLATRARSFIDEHAGVEAKRIAIVAHGFINRALAGELMGLAPEERMRIRQTNDTVIRVTMTPEGARADHFVGGEGPYGGLPDGVRRGTESA